jgi:hypothetical protein
MNEPTTLNEPIQKLLDDALRPLFGDLLPEYYAEVERHQQEQREIPKRFISGLQVTFRRAMERAIAYGPGPADEAGYELTADFNDMKDGQDISIREALEAENENHRRRVEEIKQRAARTPQS